MIEYIIPLVSSFCKGGIWNIAIVPVFCLAFLATVPVMIRRLFMR